MKCCRKVVAVRGVVKRRVRWSLYASVKHLNSTRSSRETLLPVSPVLDSFVVRFVDCAHYIFLIFFYLFNLLRDVCSHGNRNASIPTFTTRSFAAILGLTTDSSWQPNRVSLSLKVNLLIKKKYIYHFTFFRRVNFCNKTRKQIRGNLIIHISDGFSFLVDL